MARINIPNMHDPIRGIPSNYKTSFPSKFVHTVGSPLNFEYLVNRLFSIWICFENIQEKVLAYWHCCIKWIIAFLFPARNYFGDTRSGETGVTFFSGNSDNLSIVQRQVKIWRHSISSIFILGYCFCSQQPRSSRNIPEIVRHSDTSFRYTSKCGTHISVKMSAFARAASILKIFCGCLLFSHPLKCGCEPIRIGRRVAVIHPRINHIETAKRARVMGIVIPGFVPPIFCPVHLAHAVPPVRDGGVHAEDIDAVDRIVPAEPVEVDPACFGDGVLVYEQWATRHGFVAMGRATRREWSNLGAASPTRTCGIAQKTPDTVF